MTSALRQGSFFSRVSIALLAIAFVLAPFHGHGHALEKDVGSIVASLIDDGTGHSDQTPDDVGNDCAVCTLIKQLYVSVSGDQSAQDMIILAVVFPVSDGGSLQRCIADLFRPPMRAPV